MKDTKGNETTTTYLRSLAAGTVGPVVDDGLLQLEEARLGNANCVVPESRANLAITGRPVKVITKFESM